MFPHRNFLQDQFSIINLLMTPNMQVFLGGNKLQGSLKVPRKEVILNFLKYLFIYVCWFMLIASRGGTERERERESQVGSTLSAQIPTRGSIPQTMRPWPEPKSRVRSSTNWATQAFHSGDVILIFERNFRQKGKGTKHNWRDKNLDISWKIAILFQLQSADVLSRWKSVL